MFLQNSITLTQKFMTVTLLLLLLTTGCTTQDEDVIEESSREPVTLTPEKQEQNTSTEVSQEESEEIPEPQEEHVTTPTPIIEEEGAGETIAGTGVTVGEENEAETMAVSGGEALSTTFVQLDAPMESFTIQEANQTTPPDVLRELSYTGGFGGGPSCDGTEDSPVVFFLGSGERYTWFETLHFLSCGWQEGEEINVTLSMLNSSSLIDDSLTASQFGTINLSYKFPINTQPGQYELIFVGEMETLSFPIQISLPQGPKTYRMEDLLILYNFAPNESVRLLTYQDSGYFGPPFRPQFISFYGFAELQAWREYQVRENGQLLIRLDDIDYENYTYIVLGSISGEVKEFRWGLQGFNGTALSDYVLHPLRPDQSELITIDSLWNLTTYKDLVSPGQQEYDISVNAYDSWLWGFSWCAIDENTLDEILWPLSIEFYINDLRLYEGPIFEYRFNSSNGWNCQGWRVILEGWPIGELVRLDIKYSLESSIFDGAQSYPPGEYHQIFNVSVD